MPHKGCVDLFLDTWAPLPSSKCRRSHQCEGCARGRVHKAPWGAAVQDGLGGQAKGKLDQVGWDQVCESGAQLPCLGLWQRGSAWGLGWDRVTPFFPFAFASRREKELRGAESGRTSPGKPWEIKAELNLGQAPAVRTREEGTRRQAAPAPHLLLHGFHSSVAFPPHCLCFPFFLIYLFSSPLYSLPRFSSSIPQFRPLFGFLPRLPTISFSRSFLFPSPPSFPPSSVSFDPPSLCSLPPPFSFFFPPSLSPSSFFSFFLPPCPLLSFPPLFLFFLFFSSPSFSSFSRSYVFPFPSLLLFPFSFLFLAQREPG